MDQPLLTSVVGVTSVIQLSLAYARDNSNTTQSEAMPNGEGGEAPAVPSDSTGLGRGDSPRRRSYFLLLVSKP